MKIKHGIVGLISLLTLCVGMQSCGLFGGGNDCDCPKFGSNEDQYKMIYFAQQVADAASTSQL